MSVRRIVLTVFSSAVIGGGALLATAPLVAGGAAFAKGKGTKQEEPLEQVKRAVRTRDVEALKTALAPTLKVGGGKAMQALLGYASSIPEGEAKLYWTLVSGIASFADHEALETLGEYLVRNKTKPIARDVLYALARSKRPNVVFALKPILEDGPPDLQLQAANRIGMIRSWDAVDVLVDLLKREEKRSGDEPGPLMWAAVDGLTKITGKKFGRNSVNWEGWAKKNRGADLKGARPESEGVTGTAVDLLDVERKKQFIGLEQAPLENVLVISADFSHDPKIGRNFNNDHIEHVLDRMGIPHKVVTRDRFLKEDLTNTGAILVNCAQIHRMCICPTCKPDTSGGPNNRLFKCSDCNKHVEFQTQFSRPQIEKIKRFVKGGGYLFTEDWVVKELVQPAFPRYVTAGPKLRFNKQGSVEVVPNRGMATHPYLKGIYVPEPDPDEELEDDLEEELVFGDDDDDDGDKKTAGDGDSKTRIPGQEEKKVVPKEPELLDVRHRWTIDDESFSLTIANSARVVSLLQSGDLQRMGDGDSAVALVFRPGRGPPPGYGRVPGSAGVVMQVLSHFGKQSSYVDEMSLQSLLLNFLIDANTAREKRKGGGKKRKT